MLVEADGVGILDVGGAEEGFGKGDAEECGCSVGGGLKGEQGGARYCWRMRGKVTVSAWPTEKRERSSP